MQSYEGKAKRMTPRGDGTVAMLFKDDATAFNGKKHAVFPGKGELNSRMTEQLFGLLEKAGIRTQHLGRLDERTLLVREAKMIPLEVVVRFKVAGSLAKRTGLTKGKDCAPPVLEWYYKSDELGDPLLNEDHIRLLGASTPKELAELRDLALKAATKLQEIFGSAKLALVDLKFEFGHTKDGVILADEISPDTCRLWDKDTGQVMDKDRFRTDSGDLMEGYREVARRLEQALEGRAHV